MFFEKRKLFRVGINFRNLVNTKAMIKPQKNIADVKRMVKAYASKPVDVRVNLGRNKIMNFTGVLSGVYPALFTIRPDEEGFLGKTAYSYSDVLCGNVRLKVRQ